MSEDPVYCWHITMNLVIAASAMVGISILTLNYFLGHFCDVDLKVKRQVVEFISAKLNNSDLNSTEGQEIASYLQEILNYPICLR